MTGPKLNFLHVGKTGGTAIIEALREFPSTRYEVEAHPHSVCFADIPRGDKIFFVLRDPVDRFVSGFYSRQRCGAPRYNSPWSADESTAFATFPTANALAEALYTDGERGSQAEHAMAAVQHVRSSFYDWFHSNDYFVDRLDDVLFIGEIRNLRAEFEMMKQLLALPNAAHLPNDDIRAHRNPAHVDRFLSDLATANLRKWYAKDYGFYQLCSRIRAQRGVMH